MSQADVAMAAGMLARMGYVHAFGHVSQRERDQIFLTPTRPPLATLQAADVLTLSASGELLEGERERLPVEAPLHVAIYRARPDVGAVCRTHSPSVAACACLPSPPPLLHGFGGMAEPIALWPDSNLVASSQAASQAAATLGAAAALLLRGNGGLTIGQDLPEALARSWCLEDRCQIALQLGKAASPFTAAELAQRKRWYAAELARVWAWLFETYGRPQD